VSANLQLAEQGIEFQCFEVVETIDRIEHLELQVHPRCSKHGRIDAAIFEAVRLVHLPDRML
jgi:hypothetical protein